MPCEKTTKGRCMGYPVRIERSSRKTVALTVTKELWLLVRAPRHLSDAAVGAIVEKHRKWVEKHMAAQKAQNEAPKVPPPSKERIEELKKKAAELVLEKVEFFGKQMGVKAAAVKITSAEARWGSCSAKNSLCFSYKTALLADWLIDYIVVHELCHIRVKNHGAKFYIELKKHMPDYETRRAALKAAQREIAI